MSRSAAERGAPPLAAEVLLLLRTRGPALAAALAGALGRPVDDVAAALAGHSSAGRVALAPGGRWRLTADGTAAAEAVVAAERAALGALVAAEAGGFTECNRRMKEAITDWQLVRIGDGIVPNDHRDGAWDERVLARIGARLGEAARLLAPLAARRVRVATLLAGLDAALGRARDGDGRWVAGLDIDSVHTLWWCLHAEVLALRGAERSDDDA